MNNHRSVQFFDKNSSSIIEIDPYYENYYIKKGYQKLKYRF